MKGEDASLFIRKKKREKDGTNRSPLGGNVD
jgi:hypothetical protein